MYAVFMWSTASCVLGSSGIGSSKNITFHEDQKSMRCNEKVVVLTTKIDPSGKTIHEFRLDCTSAMYITPSPDAIGEWSAILPLTVQFYNVSTFFKNQDNFVKKYPLDALQLRTASIIIYFDTSNGNVNFSLVINNTLLIFYLETNETEFRYVSKSGNMFNTTLNPYMNGTDLDYLKKSRTSLDSERNVIYKYVEEHDNNNTNAYDLYIQNDTVVCVIESEAPWYYRFYIDGCRIETTVTNYDDVGATYSTVGRSHRGHKNVSTCKIEFPNGMSVTQTISVPNTETEMETVTDVPAHTICEMQKTHLFDFAVSYPPKSTARYEMSSYSNLSDDGINSYTATVPFSRKMILDAQTISTSEADSKSNPQVHTPSNIPVEQTSVNEHNTERTILVTENMQINATQTFGDQTVSIPDRVTTAMPITVAASLVSTTIIQTIDAHAVMSNITKTGVSITSISSASTNTAQTINYDSESKKSTTTSSRIKMASTQTMYTSGYNYGLMSSIPLTFDYEDEASAAKSSVIGTGSTVAIVIIVIVIALIITALVIYRRQLRLAKKKSRDIL